MQQLHRGASKGGATAPKAPGRSGHAAVCAPHQSTRAVLRFAAPRCRAGPQMERKAAEHVRSPVPHYGTGLGLSIVGAVTGPCSLVFGHFSLSLRARAALEGEGG